jgi:hypothetical protein
VELEYAESRILMTAELDLGFEEVRPFTGPSISPVRSPRCAPRASRRTPDGTWQMEDGGELALGDA